ncbi:helix-turn-helix transcriptional regulator [Paraburkholderia sp. CI3]|uniref:helix-turn-helix transcriptional regulator n=1 Tax=Paraburkholderia sp. CI3 TaxID=2991060 RepID=UPI003D1A06DC
MEHAILAAPHQGLRHYPPRTGCAERRGGAHADICLLVPADRTAVEASGRNNAGSRSHVNVRAPCIGLIPAGAKLTAAEDDPQGLVIALDSRILESRSRQVFGSSSSRELPLWFQAWDPFLREAASTLILLAQTAFVEAGCLDGFADAIALHVSYHYSRDVHARVREAPLSQLKLMLINAFISEHIAENIQVEQLAARVHMSPSHFAHAFKKTTGSPPHFHLTTERVTLAKTMLSSSRLPLIDVAARTGFRTQQHFTEVFHRYTGMTPRVFRLAAHGAQTATANDTAGAQKSDTSWQE